MTGPAETHAIETDVCVVGSGPGGATAARLVHEAGIGVVVLEEGRFHGSPSPRLSRLRDRGLQVTADRGVSILQGRAVGGAASVWQGISWPLPEDIARAWAEDIGIEALAPDAPRDAAAESGSMPGFTSPGGLPRLVPWTRATWIELLDDGGVEVRAWRTDGEGDLRPQGVRCRALVLAAGALHTPCLLLHSKLPDPHEMIGAPLRLQPTAPVFGLFDDPPGELAPDAASPDHVLLRDESWSRWRLAVDLPLWGDDLARLLDGEGYLATLSVMIREHHAGWVVPLPDGRPVSRYELRPRDRRRLRRGLEAAAERLLEAGASTVWTSHAVETAIRDRADLKLLRRRHYRAADLSLISTTPLGTCPMGADPRTSATDLSGRLHHVPGVYVADASLLPGAPGVPTGWTVRALARHVAAGVIADLGS